MDHVTFTQQAETEKTDVLVVGGGTAGLASALSSARKGLKTTLVENSGNLGGMATIGLVGPFMTCLCQEAGVRLKLYSRFLGTRTTSSDKASSIQETFVANKSGIQAI